VLTVSSIALSPQVLDELALAAYAAVISDNLNKTQVNRLIEVLESTRNVDYLLAHIARQVGRAKESRDRNVPWKKSHYSASKLFQLLKNRSYGEAKVILGIFKWLFEAGIGRRRQLDLLRRQLKINLGGKAPRDFYYKYLDTVLSP